MIFEVKALSGSGQVVVLSIDAAVEADARREAERRGLAVFLARPARSGPRLRLLPGRPGLQVLPFVHELLTLLRAGLSLVAALEAIAEKESNPGACAVVESLLLRLRRHRFQRPCRAGAHAGDQHFVQSA